MTEVRVHVVGQVHRPVGLPSSAIIARIERAMHELLQHCVRVLVWDGQFGRHELLRICRGLAHRLTFLGGLALGPEDAMYQRDRPQSIIIILFIDAG